MKVFCLWWIDRFLCGTGAAGIGFCLLQCAAEHGCWQFSGQLHLGSKSQSNKYPDIAKQEKQWHYTFHLFSVLIVGQPAWKTFLIWLYERWTVTRKWAAFILATENNHAWLGTRNKNNRGKKTLRRHQTFIRSKPQKTSEKTFVNIITSKPNNIREEKKWTQTERKPCGPSVSPFFFWRGGGGKAAERRQVVASRLQGLEANLRRHVPQAADLSATTAWGSGRGVGRGCGWCSEAKVPFFGKWLASNYLYRSFLKVFVGCSLG